MNNVKSTLLKCCSKKIIANNNISGQVILGEQNEDQVVNVTCKVFTTNCSIQEKNGKITARAIFNVVLRGDSYDNCESSVDFSFNVDDLFISKESFFDIDYQVTSINYEKNSNVISVNAQVSANVSFDYTTESDYVADCGDLITKRVNVNYLKYVCKNQGIYQTKEQKTFNLAIKKVLYHDESVVITDVQCGINTIIIDGEIYCDFTLQPFNGEPVKECLYLPFRYELECGQALPEMIANASANLVGCSYKIYVDEQGSKSNVTVLLKVETCGRVFELVSANCIDDVFSTINQLEITSNVCEYTNEIALKRYKEKKYGECACDIQQGYVLRLPFDNQITNLSYTYENNSLLIDGILKVNVLTENVEKDKKTVVAEFPFNCSFDCDCNPDAVFCDKRNVIVKQLDGKIILECELLFNVKTIKNGSVKVVCNVQEGQEKTLDNSAISVVFINKGDEMWDVCKKAGLNSQDLLRQNPNLILPCEKDVSIVVYKKINL